MSREGSVVLARTRVNNELDICEESPSIFHLRTLSDLSRPINDVYIIHDDMKHVDGGAYLSARSTESFTIVSTVVSKSA